MSKLVAGVFPSRASAEHAADELIQLGLSSSEISLVMSKQTWGREFDAPRADSGSNARMAGVLGAIAAMATAGAMYASGQAVVATGPIANGLSSLGAGVLAGGLTSALVQFGVQELDARLLEREVRRGGILVAILLSGSAPSESDDDRPSWSRTDLEEAAGLT